MTIRGDIIAAKAAYEQHLSAHKCGVLSRCPERSPLWKSWMDTAGRWGQEPDDDERQREHYKATFG